MNKQFFIGKAGGVDKLAAILRVSRQTIWAWGDEIPEDRLTQLKGAKPGWFRGMAAKAKNER